MNSLYNLNGKYWGYFDSDGIFTASGKHVGYLRNQKGYNLRGDFVGDLKEGKYLVKSRTLNSSQGIASIAPIQPIQPLEENISPLHTSEEDALPLL